MRAFKELKTILTEVTDLKRISTLLFWDQETYIPSGGIEARAQAEAVPVWAEARRQSNWKLFAPQMQITVNLARQLAEAYGYVDKPMDAL